MSGTTHWKSIIVRGRERRPGSLAPTAALTSSGSFAPFATLISATMRLKRRIIGRIIVQIRTARSPIRPITTLRIRESASD